MKMMKLMMVMVVRMMIFFCTASCWFGYNVHQLKQTTSQETEFNITTFNG